MTPPLVTSLLNRLRMRQVALLLAIETTGTLGAAAREIGMTQPAATKMLHELESMLALKLFDRIGRSLKLNAAGHLAVQSFRGMTGTLALLQRELHELALGNAGRLSVGSIMAASPTYLTRALAKLKDHCPLLSVDIEVGTSQRLMEQLDDGKLDVVIGRVPGSPMGYQFEPLSEESLAVVCAPAHPLAGLREPAFSHLTAYPWVLQPPGNPMRDVVVQEFEEHHAPLPGGVLETSSTMITVHLVARSHMIAALPQSVAKGFQKHRMLSVVRYPMRSRLAAYGSIVRADRPRSPQAAHFLRLLHEGGPAPW